MAEVRQYCTFYLDGRFFGVDVTKVREVIRFQYLTQVPLAKREISGLINLRGQIVSAIDLRRRLEMPERAKDILPINVVVKTDQRVASLLVDEIGDVVNVSLDQFEKAPETLKGVSRELIDGAFKLEKKLLLALNVDKILSLSAS